MKLRRALMVAGSAGLVALVAATFAQEPPRRDGRWEVTYQMQMEGMDMPPQKTVHCVTPEEASDPQKLMAQGGTAANPNDCKVSDFKTEGNTISWSLTCEQQQMSGTGVFTYTDDTYDGTVKMNAFGRGMTMKYSGKRLGDCPAQ